MTTSSTTEQFLSFVIDNEMYAIEILQVREIMDLTKVTPVPQMPNFVKGVINLRGKVVPVIDLRVKFDLHIEESTVNTCIIIIEVSIDGELTLLGVIADSVKEVITIDYKDIEPAPKLGTRLNSEFIKGMSKKNDDFIILLNVEKIFSQDELSYVSSVHSSIDESDEEVVEE